MTSICAHIITQVTVPNNAEKDLVVGPVWQVLYNVYKFIDICTVAVVSMTKNNVTQPCSWMLLTLAD
eukprot:scaffold6708_cov134-Cylindrotheca_fusiformis.AAC.23